MGLLVNLRESWAEFLRSSTNDKDGGPAAYFSAAPVIPIYTEKLATINEAIEAAKRQLGLCVVVVTVTARQGQNQVPGQLYFKDIAIVARVMETPRTNRTGVSASDCAEAIAWFTRRFRGPEDTAMLFQDIALAAMPGGVAYDVIYAAEGGITSAPVRPATNP